MAAPSYGGPEPRLEHDRRFQPRKCVRSESTNPIQPVRQLERYFTTVTYTIRLHLIAPPSAY